MARVGTSLLNLGMWRQGENPGAGSQTADSLFLNGNFWKIDAWANTAHDASGNHKAGVIHSDDLNSDCADGSSIDLSGGTIAVKTGGVDGPHLKSSSVDNSTIQLSGSPLKLSLKDGGITTAKFVSGIVDDSTIAISSNQLIVKDAGVTRAKMAVYTIYGHHAFDTRNAGTSAGNAPASELNWAETSAAYVDKFSWHMLKSSQSKYVRFLCQVQMSSSSFTGTVLLTVTDGVSPVTHSGTTTSTGWNGVSCLVDISTFTDWTILTASVSIKTTGGTMTLRRPVTASLPT